MALGKGIILGGSQGGGKVGELRRFFPRQVYGVVCGYRGPGEHPGIDASIAGVEIREDDSLVLHLPRPHRFCLGQALTIHLDDRQGSELFSIELRVNRSSYKGLVTLIDGQRVGLAPIHYELVYGTRILAAFSSPGYVHPRDERPELPLAESPMEDFSLPSRQEEGNKLGVWITRGIGRPHTTVMAFLSDDEDNVFVISQPATLKARNVQRDADCCFAIDHRASYVFERAVDWNWSILRMKAHVISEDRPLFARIQALFVEKNPWEAAFFGAPDIELYHLAPESLVWPDEE